MQATEILFSLGGRLVNVMCYQYCYKQIGIDCNQ